MWLGYPGTSGASFMDYIVTDKYTSPPHLASLYSEKLAYMPHTFFVGDHAQMFPHLLSEGHGDVGVNLANVRPLYTDPVRSAQTFASVAATSALAHTDTRSAAGPNNMQSVKVGVSAVVDASTAAGLSTRVASGELPAAVVPFTARAQYKLPEDKIIFCNFNQLYKVDPNTTKMWANILKAVPNSVLWLLRFPAHGEANLLATMTRLGVGREQVIFSDVAPKEEHVRRGRLADVCLDTPLCNGHTTGMDVLWAGTPMVTLRGETLASRVASSLLMTLGAPELVADTPHQYEEIAIRLGSNPAR